MKSLVWYYNIAFAKLALLGDGNLQGIEIIRYEQD
jgi:hypothetical protein